MKNVHKIRGKREFLFDDRELIILGGGAFVICVLIFVLGFLIGQSLGEKSVASTLDSEDYMAKEEFTPAKSEITENPIIESNPQEVPTSEKKPPGGYYRVLPQSKEYVEVEANPGEESTPLPSSEEESQPEKVEAETSQQEVREEASSQPSVMATPSPRQDVAVAPALPNVPKSPTDAMHVGRPMPHLEEETILSGIVYAVQVSSSPDRVDSEQLLQKYMDLGYQAYVMPADLGERGIWYRVLVGNFTTKEEAEQLKQDILNRAAHLANDPLVKKIE